MDGFERFAQGHLITLFSATNYCGTANNAGAILVLGRDFVMVSTDRNVASCLRTFCVVTVYMNGSHSLHWIAACTAVYDTY